LQNITTYVQTNKGNTKLQKGPTTCSKT